VISLNAKTIAELPNLRFGASTALRQTPCRTPTSYRGAGVRHGTGEKNNKVRQIRPSGGGTLPCGENYSW
jgi:hypothetical protein